MENFARRRKGRKFDVIVQRNLICWNWDLLDLPDLWIFGLLIEIFARRRNGRKFDVIVQRNLICWNWDLPDIWIFGLLDGKFRAKTQRSQI
jgi:hypothetical protein